ncbi:hypothetical protein [Peribacillus frigoritolerans]|uniref:hypothetical protein n=1 Tax=Peribacillus frigoritolerans TaxID=450367 RepID=UPI002E21B2E8|nr:hypothetical protein [Peribacillus frigoritolerans]
MKNAKRITVTYLFEGKIYPTENTPGLLLSGDKVFVTDERLAVYKATPTSDPNVYLVNLDVNDNDYLQNSGPVMEAIGAC